MDLLEILIIALFILFPVMEGILKQRRKPKGPDRVEGDESTDEAPWMQAEPEEPRTAADMVPDDLWEVMTGERREGPEPREAGEGSWPAEPEEGLGEPVSTPPAESAEDWRSEAWVVDDERLAEEPESLEYEGPEAYTLETPAPEPRSLERPVPSASARHARFHDLIDRPEPRRSARASSLVRSLRSSKGLRQAVLLKEILGPPKGLP